MGGIGSLHALAVLFKSIFGRADHDGAMTRMWLVVGAIVLSGCGVIGGSSDVVGYPEVNLGADSVEVYKTTEERDLHMHIFEPEETSSATVRPGAVVFFHGGGFRSTRVEQFRGQAQSLAAEGIVGIVAEYRVTAEGTTRADAVVDGQDVVAALRADAAQFRIDPDRVAVAGASAGAALAVEASEQSSALVLFNPAVDASSAPFVDGQPAIAFHSREDTIVAFSSAEGFCDAVTGCELVAFDEGDHGFFNNEPALTETTNAMIEFLQDNGW